MLGGAFPMTVPRWSPERLWCRTSLLSDCAGGWAAWCQSDHTSLSAAWV